MEKAFQEYLIKELDEIKNGVKKLSCELQKSKEENAEKYVTKKEYSMNIVERKGQQNTVFGWIIGVYTLVVTISVTLFSILLSRR